jgi:hypothetical protein
MLQSFSIKGAEFESTIKTLHRAFSLLLVSYLIEFIEEYLTLIDFGLNFLKLPKTYFFFSLCLKNIHRRLSF